MKQVLVINRNYYNSVNKKTNLEIIKTYGYKNADSFFKAICERLNQEYSFLNIKDYEFQTTEEARIYKTFNAFIRGDVSPYKDVTISFTPINTKLGNTNIVQEIMPMIANQMQINKNFLLDGNIKRICVLTSQFNKQNIISKEYNTLQMNVTSLNTLNFDVIQFFRVKHLSTDTSYGSLNEYLDMVEFLQKKNQANDQFEYFKLENDILYGNAQASQIKGQWQKAFVFKYLTAIFLGKKQFKYNIDGVLIHGIVDNQLKNLNDFIDYVNNTEMDFTTFVEIPTDDVVESNDNVADTDDINREPEQATGKSGRKRYKTQRKIRDKVLKDYNYTCNCHDQKHFYFESSDSFNNYVEGHHMIPMNRQAEYWEDKKINLDVESNIVALCPTCHAQIHLGSRRARLDIISEIFVRDEVKLKRVDKDINLIKLVSFYNIGLEKEEEKYLIQNATIKVQRKREGTI